MSDDRDDPLHALLVLQEATERGPTREGYFAVWLLTRVALDIGLGAEDGDRADRRRVDLLARRLAPLAVPRPLARGLTAALGHLADATCAGARIALAQLVAPTRDALGSDAADAVAHAARLIHDHHRRIAP